MLETDLKNLPAEQQSTVAAALNESVLLTLAEEIDTLLSPQDHIVFDELLTRDNIGADTQLVQFLQSKVPDLDARIQRIRESKLAELEAGVAEVRKRLAERIASRTQ